MSFAKNLYFCGLFVSMSRGEDVLSHKKFV